MSEDTSNKIRWTDKIKYVGYLAITAIAVTLPLRFAYWLGHRVCWFYYKFDYKGANAYRRNLRQILGDNAHENTIEYYTRWSYRSIGKYLVEFLGFRRFNKEFMKERVQVSGIESIDNALKEGNGCIALSAHIGNWELGGAYLGLHGYPITATVWRQPDSLINNIFQETRKSTGMNILTVGNSARTVFRALKNNQLVSIMCDRPDANPVEVEFFGKKRLFPQGPARIAMTAKCPVVLVFNLREWDDTFRLDFRLLEAPIDEGTKEERVKEFTQRYAKLLEVVVLKHVTQWQAFYDVWPQDETQEGSK